MNPRRKGWNDSTERVSGDDESMYLISLHPAEWAKASWIARKDEKISKFGEIGMILVISLNIIRDFFGRRFMRFHVLD